MKHSTDLLNLTFGFSFSLLSLVPFCLPVSVSANTFAEPLLQNKQAPGQVGGSPKGGGTFGGCENVSTPLTALVPYTIDRSKSLPVTYVGGVTTSANPTLWFYVPYKLTADLTANFILQNDQREIVYQVSSSDFTVQPDGFLSIPISIEVGKLYHWYFTVNCDLQGDSEVPIYVDGGIERISLDPTLASQLATLSPKAQAELYQQKKLWYDAITVLGDLRREHPNDAAIASQWNATLLNAANIIDR